MRKANSKSFKIGHGLKDLRGQRFGRLLVIGRDGTYLKNKSAVWSCKCDCGRITSVRGTSLRNGTTRSCGCLSKEITSARMMLPNSQASFNALYYCYKRNAKKRGWVFNIDKSLFHQLVTQPCHYCGEYPSNQYMSNKNANGVFIYNGLDRVKNEIGYIPSNVVPCCRRCNYVKATLSVDEFISYCRKVVNYCEKNKLRIA